MLVALGLAFLALLFPPLWLAFAGYIIYLIATSEQRRKRVIMREVVSMLNLGQTERVVKHIHYDSAAKFVSESGAPLSGKTMSYVDMLLSGIPYRVYFQPWKKNDVRITIYTADDLIAMKKGVMSD